MKRTLAIGLVSLLLAGSAWLAAQERNGPRPPRPAQTEPAQPPGVGIGGFQPPDGGPGIPPGFPRPPGLADHKELVAALIENLDDVDAETRTSIATALAKVGRQAVMPLVGVLKDKDKSAAVRANAAYVLGQIGPQAQEALPELTKALKEKDRELRKRVAFALANIVQGDGFLDFPGGFPGGIEVAPGFPGRRGKAPADPGIVAPPEKAPAPPEKK